MNKEEASYIKLAICVLAIILLISIMIELPVKPSEFEQDIQNKISLLENYKNMASNALILPYDSLIQESKLELMQYKYGTKSTRMDLNILYTNNTEVTISLVY